MFSIGIVRKLVRYFTYFISGLLSFLLLTPLMSFPSHAGSTGVTGALVAQSPQPGVIQDLSEFNLNPATAPLIPEGLRRSSNPAEGSRAIIGQDDRLLMTSRSYPWSAIGRIRGINDEGDGYICSGTLIAADVVLTNAHCVVNPETHQFSRQIFFEPNLVNGRVQDNDDVATVIKVMAGTDFSDDPVPPNINDWALVKLNKSLGEVYGTLEWEPLPTTVLMNNPSKFILIGYSGDINDGNTASVHDGCSILDEKDGAFEHDCDTFGGSSGGPILGLIDGEYRIVAVNSAGQTDRRGVGIVNFATRIQQIIDQL